MAFELNTVNIGTLAFAVFPEVAPIFIMNDSILVTFALIKLKAIDFKIPALAPAPLN